MPTLRVIFAAVLLGIGAARVQAGNPASGPATHEVDPEIARLAHDLGSEHTDIRLAAIDRLEKLGPSVIPAMAAALAKLDESASSTDPNFIRRTFMWNLVIHDYGAAAAPVLLHEIETGSPDSAEAAIALANLNKDAAFAVSSLCKLATSKSPEVSAAMTALEALARYDPPTALPAMLRILRDPGNLEQSEAARTIGNMGPAAASAFGPLCDCLKSADQPYDRQCAYEAIGKIADAKQAMPILLAGMHDADATARRGVAQGLSALSSRAPGEEILPPLLVLLANPDTQFDASRALGQIPRLAAPACARKLKDKDPVVRCGAADALAECDVYALPILAQLAQAVHDPDVKVAQAAARAIGELFALAGPAVPDLLKELEANRPEDRESILRALQWIGPPAAPALHPLIRLLGDSDAYVRKSACRAIGAIHAEPSIAIPALRDIIATDPGVADDAMAAAAQYKAAAGECIPPMIAAARRNDLAAIAGLRTIGWDSPLGLGALLEIGQTTPPRDGMIILNNLVSVDPPIKEAGPIYAAALNDPDNTDNHDAAILGLLCLNVPENSPEAAPLVRAASYRNADTRLLARAAVARMHGDQATAKKLLAQLATTVYPDEGIILFDARVVAMVAMRRCYPAEAETTWMLQTNLRSTSPLLKVNALGLVSEMGPAGRGWMQALRECLGSSEKGIRVQAALAMRRLDPAADITP